MVLPIVPVLGPRRVSGIAGADIAAPGRGSRRRLLELGGRDNFIELLQFPIHVSFRQRHCSVRISVLTVMIDGTFHSDSVQFTSGTCVSSGIFIGVTRLCVSSGIC